MKGWQLAVVLTAALGALLVWQLGRAHRRWQASRILRTVEAVTQRVQEAGSTVPPRVRQQLLQRNLEILKQAAEQAPDEVTNLVLRGGQYSLLGRQELALRSYRQALALEPRAEIYLNLGHLHWAREEREEARRAFTFAGFLDHSQVPSLRKFFAAGERPWGHPQTTLAPLLEPSGQLSANGSVSGGGVAGGGAGEIGGKNGESTPKRSGNTRGPRLNRPAKRGQGGIG